MVRGQGGNRFRLAWRWDGSEAVLPSRAVDDLGYRQPAVVDLFNNGIKAWKVSPDGWVSSVNV